MTYNFNKSISLLFFLFGNFLLLKWWAVFNLHLSSHNIRLRNLIFKIIYLDLNISRIGIKLLMVWSTLGWWSWFDDIGHEFKYFVCFFQFSTFHDIFVLLEEWHVHRMFLSSPMACIVLGIMGLLNMLSLDFCVIFCFRL